ncbi:spore coat U domain-containing protein (plasmid) [Escherichia coli]|uniref:Csu type fimbrial protein n=1 Tax=Enterobacteriaceae TaxID=543 RepID=UPI002DBA2D37|nr:spore coat U domain-containing protein [Kluyvera cryocrescens]MEB7558818.1 spore coat U domain-containing protein [Kluyvera cryocrescens]HBR1133651.1 spore coat protein U domain-containing protein [Klebsiella quasipneumoniae subsp. similipneumoniae]
MRFHHLLIMLLIFSSMSKADTTTSTFTVSATVENGCVFGDDTGSSITDFGTIDFGTMSSISSTVDVASSTGSGSVVVTCTPGLAATIELDYGANGGDSSARYLINSSGTRTIAYQLYQDSNHTTVWGTGSQAYSISSFPDTTQTYTVYARLFASSEMPEAGSYTDTVTVTLTY